MNTDTLFDFDIESMFRHHIFRNAAVTLSSVEVISPWGILTVVGEDVVGFDRNRKVQKLISSHVHDGYGVVNSGLAWIKKSALNLVDFDNAGDFETDLFGAAIREGKVAHFKLDGIWVPIDTPKDLAAINYTLDTDAKDSEPIKNLLSNLEQTIILNPDRDH